MATYITRNGRTTARVRKLGISVTDTFPTKTKAKAWATQTEADIINGKFTGKPAGKTLSDALTRYLAEETPKKRGIVQETSRINNFLKQQIAKMQLSDVTTPVLAQWRDDRLKEVKAATVLSELSIFSAVFEVARKEWQWVTENPVRDVNKPTKPPHRERLYHDDEIELIANALEPLVKDAFLLALETGMRRSEILTLEWGWIELDRRFLTLPLTKNGDARHVPLSSKAVDILRGRLGETRPFDINENCFGRRFTLAVKNCGIKDATFHDTRHTAITRLADKLSVLELARMIGHRNISQLMTYYNKTAEDLAKKLD